MHEKCERVDDYYDDYNDKLDCLAFSQNNQHTNIYSFIRSFIHSSLPDVTTYTALEIQTPNTQVKLGEICYLVLFLAAFFIFWLKNPTTTNATLNRDEEFSYTHSHSHTHMFSSYTWKQHADNALQRACFFLYFLFFFIKYGNTYILFGSVCVCIYILCLCQLFIFPINS